MNNKLEKARKTVGKETIVELEGMSPEQLRHRVSQANEAMQEAADALDAHPGYKKAKEDAHAFGAAKRDVDKRQKAIIRVALSLLNHD